MKKEIKNTFKGGMIKDDDSVLLPKNRYKYAENAVMPETKVKKSRTTFIKLSSYGIIPYPVGYRMEQTIPIVKDMADKLKYLFPVSSLPLNGGEKPQLIFCVRGSSGAILSGLISSYLFDYNIVINHIKKDGERSHGGNSNLYFPEEYPRIILDDIIDSGETVNAIYSAIINSSGNNRVDCLCVSGRVKEWQLDFRPDNVIASFFTDNSGQVVEPKN